MFIKLEWETLHLLCRLAVGLSALVLISATAAPFLHSDAWWIRGFDFPRIQIAVLIALTLLGYALLRHWHPLCVWERSFVALAGASLIWQLMYAHASTENEEPRLQQDDVQEADKAIQKGKDHD